MRTRTEIDSKIKFYENQLLQKFGCMSTTELDELEYSLISQKIMLLEWIKGVDIYRDEAF